MGKRPKRGLKNIFCCGNMSSEKKDEDTDGQKAGEYKKGSKEPSEAETLSQEIAELDEKIQCLISSLDALEDKFEATEHKIMEFFGRSAVEKLENEYFYTVPQMILNTKMRSSTDTEASISTSVVKNWEPNSTESFSTYTSVESTTRVIYQVPTLTHQCRRMFYHDFTANVESGGYRMLYTDLALKYINVASQNMRRGVHQLGEEVQAILPLWKMCYMSLAMENAEKARDVVSAELQDADDKWKLDTQPTGKFGQTRDIEFGLARGTQQFEVQSVLDSTGLAVALRSLQNTQAVLHQEILNIADFPFRVSFKEIMFRNQLYESHAKFLCINMLMSLQYLHSLKIVHGRITPSAVIFTKLGYPYLIGVDSDRPACVDTRGSQSRLDYVSPEQLQDSTISTATDIFLTGILVYSTIYGKSPFEADTQHKTRANILDETFIPELDPDTISKDGRMFTRKLLKMNPDNRFKVDRCKSPLTKEVKWFSTMSQHDIIHQTYPSPFKEFLMGDILTE